MTNPIDLLISARWILPIAPQKTLLENHAIAVHEGKIKAILPLHEIKNKFSAKKYVELKNHVLMPGFVNAHAHTPMNLFRGLADDLALMDWLNNHIWPAEKALINETSVKIGSQLAIAEMLRGGITCFNDHYFFPHITAQVAIDAGIRACLGNVIMSVPTEWAADEAGYFKKAILILENRPENNLITWSLAPHAPYTVSDACFKEIKQLAAQYHLPIHIHLHETQAEIEASLKEFGMRPIERLHRLGLLSDKLISVHMTQLNNDEIQLLKKHKVSVVHCPESNLKLASGFAPIGKLIKAGVNVALGTDGAASNNDLDLMGEMRTASMLAKAVAEDPTTLPAFEALKMATLNGARALGLSHAIGSLEANKYADMIAIDLSSYLMEPIYNPISHLVYAANRMQVSDVWVAGKQLLKKGELLQLDIEHLIKEAHKIVEKAVSFQNRQYCYES